MKPITQKEVLIIDTQRDIEAIIEILTLVFGDWDRKVERRLNGVLRDMIDDINSQRARPKQALVHYYAIGLLNDHFKPPYHMYLVTPDGEIDATDPRKDQRELKQIIVSLKKTIESTAKEHKLYEPDNAFPYYYLPVDNNLIANPCIKLRRFRTDG